MGTAVPAAVLLFSVPLFSLMCSDLFCLTIFVSFGDRDCDTEQ